MVLPLLHSAQNGAQMLFKVKEGRAWKGLGGLLYQLQTMSLLALPG